MSGGITPGSRMRPVLRPARIEDLDAIMALETLVFGPEAWSAPAMRRDMIDPNCVYVVAEAEAEAEAEAGAEAEGLLLGYAGLLCPRGSGDGDIQTIAVNPQHQGAGLGRALMLVLLQRAEERLATRIFLEVRADNVVARALYESLGFEEIAVRPNYYQPGGIDAIVMRREEITGPPRPASIGSEIFS